MINDNNNDNNNNNSNNGGFGKIGHRDGTGNYYKRKYETFFSLLLNFCVRGKIRERKRRGKKGLKE